MIYNSKLWHNYELLCLVLDRQAEETQEKLLLPYFRPFPLKIMPKQTNKQ